AASRMSNRPLLLRSQDLLPAEERTLELEEEGLEYQRCVGFLLTDVQTGPVGTIVEILEYPQQEMAVVRQEAREWLIPLHAGLIHELDEAERVLRMDLPEGLLDL
ncbi:MAG: 16S rRNA processing protein RimM, partial [Bacteroidota bacterium]